MRQDLILVFIAISVVLSDNTIRDRKIRCNGNNDEFFKQFQI